MINNCLYFPLYTPNLGSVLSAFFEKLESIVLFSLMYDYLGVSLSGAYVSLK